MARWNLLSGCSALVIFSYVWLLPYPRTSSTTVTHKILVALLGTSPVIYLGLSRMLHVRLFQEYISRCFTEQYSDSVGSRSLSASSFSSGSMTNDACTEFCGNGGYDFAGTEYAQECWCGYRLSTSSKKAPDSDCSFACSGPDFLDPYHMTPC